MTRINLGSLQFVVFIPYFKDLVISDRKYKLVIIRNNNIIYALSVHHWNLFYHVY
jgi:hypothetical protein